MSGYLVYENPRKSTRSSGVPLPFFCPWLPAEWNSPAGSGVELPNSDISKSFPTRWASKGGVSALESRCTKRKKVQSTLSSSFPSSSLPRACLAFGPEQAVAKCKRQFRPKGQCERGRRGPAAVSARRETMKQLSIRAPHKPATTLATANGMHKTAKSKIKSTLPWQLPPPAQKAPAVARSNLPDSPRGAETALARGRPRWPNDDPAAQSPL